MAVNAASPAEMAGRASAAMAVSASGVPTVLTAAAPAATTVPQHAPAPMQPQRGPPPMQVPNGSAPMQQPRQQPIQTPPRATFNSPSNCAPPRHTNGPLASSYVNSNGGTAPHPASAVNGVASRISAMQAVEMNKRQAVASSVHGGPTAATPVGQQQQRAYQPNLAPQNQPLTTSSAPPFGQGPQYLRQPLHTIGMNAPPPTRGGYQPQSSPLIKAETSRAQPPPAAYDINDLSLSQFDYEPQR